MTAVKFDFLNIVSDVSVENGEVYFTLKNSMTSIEQCYLTASIKPKNKSLSVEVNNTNDPQNSRDVDIDCFCVDSNTVALVDDFDGLHAVHDMPFKLTGNQVNTINSYLEEIAEGEMK